MTVFVFSDASARWLEENSFSDDEVKELQKILNAIEGHKNKNVSRIKIPKEASPKVSTLVYLLDSITDQQDRPICFEESGFIEIPDEAKEHYMDDLELEELERITGVLRKTKFARRYSYPRRRGTVKDTRTSLE